MSDATTPNSSSAICELALDYVYGELDDARKRTFEEHLATCARCQAEVASFGKVRAATKRLMPEQEPSAQLTGALHAQLMHAAAQRKPKRGVLLSFPRRIVEHPGLAAAAMFAIVGGAIAINWSAGKLSMPATTAETAKQAEAPAAAPAAEPVPAAKAKEEEAAAADDSAKGGFAAVEKDAPKIALETPQGPMKVTRTPAAAPARRAVAKSEAAPPAKMKNIAIDGKAASKKYDDKALAEDIATERDGLGEGSTSGGVTGGVIGGGGAGAAAKSSAPGDVYAAHAESANKAAKPAPAPAQSQSRGYANAPPATTPPPAMAMREPQTAPAPPPPAVTSTVAKPSAGRSYDGVRKQAAEYAQSNRCDEALKLYAELDKAGQYLSPTERVHWVRCLTQKGRQEEAQQRLDELKQEKRVTNAQIQDAERELSDSRRRAESQEAKKKAKKAPAADRAVPTTASEQRVAEPPPAEAAPPDSTHTKVKRQSGQSY